MFALSDKVPIVTHASSGIGSATAKVFAREVAKVVAAARRQPGLDALVEEIAKAGGFVLVLAGEVKDESFAEDPVNLAESRFGGVDVGCDDADMIGAVGPTSDVSLSEWNVTIRTIPSSAFLGAGYQVPAKLGRDGGSVILRPRSSVTRWAFRRQGSPSERPLARREGFAQGPDICQYLGIHGVRALKRMSSPDEIANLVLYLAFDGSEFCHRFGDPC